MLTDKDAQASVVDFPNQSISCTEPSPLPLFIEEGNSCYQSSARITESTPSTPRAAG
jgi:hypothetical protein